MAPPTNLKQFNLTLRAGEMPSSLACSTRWPKNGNSGNGPSYRGLQLSGLVAIGLRRPSQPVRKFSIPGVFDDVLTDQLPHNLGRGQILAGTDFLKDPLLAWVDENGQARGAVFHVPWHVSDVNQIIIAIVPGYNIIYLQC